MGAGVAGVVGAGVGPPARDLQMMKGAGSGGGVTVESGFAKTIIKKALLSG